MDGLYLDLKHALRSILTAPRFAAVVIATLALGTGANTAVFGVLNAVVLRPLPYEEPDRLVRVYHAAGGDDNAYLTGPAAVAYRDQSRTLDVAITYTYSVEGADLTDRGEPERVRVMGVSADYFRVLRAHPLLGRPFERADEQRDARVAVISEHVWRRHLDAAPDAPGRPLTLNGIAYRVAAVLPDEFDDPLGDDVQVWTPLNLQPGGPNSFDNYYLSIIARLQPGATVAQAQAELTTVAAGMQRDVPASQPRWSARVVPLQVDTVGSARGLLWILLGAVGLLLIIACVNVASLLLARAAARESELAVRSALGCSRTRLVRQLLFESVLLALAGGAAGLVLAPIVSRALLAAAPAVVARGGGSGLERAVLLFSAVVACACGIAFGVAPALQATRTNLDAALRESGRGGGASRRQMRTRNALVVCQIALALVLLIGAGLLLQSFERLRAVAVGVTPSNVVTFTVNLPAGRYGDPEQRARFHREFAARLTALPGVRAAGAVSRLPVTGTYHSWGVRRGDSPKTRFMPAQQRVIEGSYFAAVGIPLLRGRTFGRDDDAKAPRRVVVSQELARQLFPAEEAVGKTIEVAGAQAEIIGVVGDVALGARTPAKPYVYHSHSQFAADRNWSLTQVVALAGTPASRASSDQRLPSLLADVYRELGQIDPGLVLYQPRLLEDVIGGGVAQDRFALLLVAAFATLAVVLAAIGIYGALSYSVSRRSREMGIRMALGATTRMVQSMIVQDGGRMALTGIAAGSIASLASTRLLGSMLFGVSPTEPRVFAAAAGLLAVVAMMASWMPARAATRANPMTIVKD
jgi:putative ABC transport system permease protein